MTLKFKAWDYLLKKIYNTTLAQLRDYAAPKITILYN
jgi:hypothetical protein